MWMLLGAASGCGGCERDRKPPPPQEQKTTASASFATTASARGVPCASLDAGSSPLPVARIEEQALFDANPMHPFNAAHRALFDQRIRARLDACAGGARCFTIEPPFSFASHEGLDLLEGGDTSSVLLRGGMDFLADDSRLRQALDALAAAAKVAPQDRAIAAALFQHDLWERFDGLEGMDRDGNAKHRLAAKALRDRLADIIWALALRAESIRALLPNLPEVVRAHCTLLEGLDTGRGWVEIAVRSKDGPSAEEREVPRHTQAVGFRSAFRRFVRVPDDAGGSDGLRRALAADASTPRLPERTRAVLVEVPFVLANDGRVVPLPLVTLVETRVVAGAFAPAEKRSLGDAPFDVLEARRSWLTAPNRISGGLELLPADAPNPLGGSCNVNHVAAFVPVRNACPQCHNGPFGGDTLSTTMAHFPSRFRSVEDPDAVVAIAVAMKERSLAYAALRKRALH